MMLPSSTHQQPAGFSLEPRTWVQLAADVTDGLLDTKYKSLAVYAEVKLAEALDRAAQVCWRPCEVVSLRVCGSVVCTVRPLCLLLAANTGWLLLQPHGM